jgi:hypothetical protein
MLGVNLYADLKKRSTRRHIPEDDILHSHGCESLKSYKTRYVYVCDMLVDASLRDPEVGCREYSTLGRLRLMSATLKTSSRKYLLEFAVCSLFEER